MCSISLKSLLFNIYLIIFCVVSKILFINVYDVSGYVVDELFHVPQGLKYCNFNFTAWDPKITTLPGLYLVSALMMAPFGFCTMYGMRLTNLFGSFVNLLLFVKLFHLELDSPTTSPSWSAIISGISMGIFPPLYFFTHFYYTDTISVTTVLLMILLTKKNNHIGAAIIGIFSVIVRQTNIIWVVMLFGESILDLFVNVTSEKSRRRKSGKRTDFWNLYECCGNFIKKRCNFNRITHDNYTAIFSYLSVMIAFIVFVAINGGIVVGDKSAHEAAIHIPQLFYFSLFCVIFGLPHFCFEIFPFIKYIWRNKLLFIALISTFSCIVHYNTLVHPYLLADNRHYTFYVWNRMYGKYSAAKYILTGVYLYGIYAAFKTIDAIKNFGFLLVYLPCITAVLILQKLLDVRYFLIPFILLRMKFKTKNRIILISEFIMYLIINYLTFFVFFTKEIFWVDFPNAQRIIW